MENEVAAEYIRTAELLAERLINEHLLSHCVATTSSCTTNDNNMEYSNEQIHEIHEIEANSVHNDTTAHNHTCNGEHLDAKDYAKR
jgi:hypothetical protein